MHSEAKPDDATRRAKALLLLGCGWLERGKGDVAAKHLERALTLDPQLPGLHRWLAYLNVWRGELKVAAKHMDMALKQTPDSDPLRYEAGLLYELAGRPPKPVDLPDHPGGRLRFIRRYQRNHHRSGWRYAVEALYDLHHTDGVLFDDFLEEPFAWRCPRPGIRSGPELLTALRSRDYDLRLTSEERRVIPYRKPWVGFMHNPPNMPSWFHYQESPRTILAKPAWQESMRHCVGLFALSEYAASWLRKQTGKPVSAVLHPTQTPKLLFDFDCFTANSNKLIIQIGWWLRSLSAIDRLPIAKNNPMGFTKVRLTPHFFTGAAAYLKTLRENEVDREGNPPPQYAANTMERQHAPNDEYDRLLAQNICFVHLLDASANNAVIECLVRATPILVNRLPAVEEYLGPGYPLYYTDLADAAAKALDMGRLRAAHDYMRKWEIRHRLDQETFRCSVENSEVYQLL